MAAPSASSVIRVFVSSTFVDMQAERNFLVGEVFPDIRRQCAAMGIDFEAIDLRWGVSSESSDAEVLGYCLDQIEGCLPYLLAMIGGRYGWVPGKQPDLAATLAPAEAECSVTELEILRFEQGVARAGWPPRALVGLRSDALTQALVADETEAPQERQRLLALRDRLRLRPDAFEYADLDTLGTSVRDFFLARARALAEELATTTRQIDAQQARYLHLQRIAGVPRLARVLVAGATPAQARPLDEDGLVALLGAERLQVLLGGPGSGKTALCSAVAERWQALGQERRVLRLHVGATGELSLDGVLRNLYGLADAGQPRDWADGLVDALDADPRPTLVVLDGLERMIGWRQALPSTLEVIGHQPYQLLLTVEKLLRARCRPSVLLACDPDVQPDNAFGAMVADGDLQLDPYAPAFTVGVTRLGALDATARRDFAAAFFAFRGKHLTQAQLARIGQAQQLDDFDALHLACDRLRRFGDLNRARVDQDSFVAGHIEDLFGQSRAQALAALVAEARCARGLVPAKVDAMLLLLAVSCYGLPPAELVAAATQLAGQPVSLRDWAIIEGMFAPVLARSSTRMQYKNGAVLRDVLATLDPAAVPRARAALVEHLRVHVAAAGLAGAFSVTVDAVYPNELAWQLQALPDHAGWRALFDPVGLLAWFARDCEMALVELNTAFNAGTFERAFAHNCDSVDPLASIAQFRAAVTAFVGQSDAAAIQRFERALDWAHNALFLPEASSRGWALLAARLSSCALCAAREDILPSADHCRSALLATVNLLSSVIGQYGAGDARVTGLRALLAGWHARAAGYAPAADRVRRPVAYMEELDLAVAGVDRRIGAA